MKVQGLFAPPARGVYYRAWVIATRVVVVNPSPKADRCDELLINGFNLFWLLGQDNARRNNKTKENRRMDGQSQKLLLLENANMRQKNGPSFSQKNTVHQLLARKTLASLHFERFFHQLTTVWCGFCVHAIPYHRTLPQNKNKNMDAPFRFVFKRGKILVSHFLLIFSICYGREIRDF